MKYILHSDFGRVSEVPLIDFEFEAETVWGDYPGSRTGTGRYCDLFSAGIPVGRLWANGLTVGLLHLAVVGDFPVQRTAEIQHWNAAMDIRQSFHLQVSAVEAFDSIAAKYDHGAVVLAADLSVINFPEIDAEFYIDRYDPTDTRIWCEEMQ